VQAASYINTKHGSKNRVVLDFSSTEASFSIGIGYRSYLPAVVLFLIALDD